MITIYRFKVYNSIGNVFDIGRMVGTREEVELFCKKQVKEAFKNSPCKWEYLIEQITIPRQRKSLTNNKNYVYEKTNSN